MVIGPTGTILNSTIPLTGGDGKYLSGVTGDTNQPGSPPQGLSLSTGRYRVARLPARSSLPEPETRFLYALFPEEHWDRVAWRAAWPPLIAGLVAAIIAVISTTVVSRRFTSRVRLLSQQASEIAGGTFRSAPLPATDDELRDLAAALNRMSDQLGNYESQVRRSERLRTLGQLGAGIAHQLRNSATGALMALEFHAAELPVTQDRESLDVAFRQLRLMESSLKRFLQFGRENHPQLQQLSLRAVIDETLLLVEPSCRHALIDLKWDRPAQDSVIEGEHDALQQMLLNLLVNGIEAATDASGQPGTVQVQLECVRGDNFHVDLRVLDSGPGPSDQMQSRLFEPFATSKPDGTGLGLSVAQEIAKAHGANLSWRRINGMTCFEVRFPLTSLP